MHSAVINEPSRPYCRVNQAQVHWRFITYFILALFCLESGRLSANRRSESTQGTHQIRQRRFWNKNEDTTRHHYLPAELKKFDGIESEWPVFFAFSYRCKVQTGGWTSCNLSPVEFCLVNQRCPTYYQVWIQFFSKNFQICLQNFFSIFFFNFSNLCSFLHFFSYCFSIFKIFIKVRKIPEPVFRRNMTWVDSINIAVCCRMEWWVRRTWIRWGWPRVELLVVLMKELFKWRWFRKIHHFKGFCPLMGSSQRHLLKLNPSSFGQVKI